MQQLSCTYLVLLLMTHDRLLYHDVSPNCIQKQQHFGVPLGGVSTNDTDDFRQIKLRRVNCLLAHLWVCFCHWQYYQTVHVRTLELKQLASHPTSSKRIHVENSLYGYSYWKPCSRSISTMFSFFKLHRFTFL